MISTHLVRDREVILIVVPRNNGALGHHWGTVVIVRTLVRVRTLLKDTMPVLWDWDKPTNIKLAVEKLTTLVVSSIVLSVNWFLTLILKLFPWIPALAWSQDKNNLGVLCCQSTRVQEIYRWSRWLCPACQQKNLEVKSPYTRSSETVRSYIRIRNVERSWWANGSQCTWDIRKDSKCQSESSGEEHFGWELRAKRRATAIGQLYSAPGSGY